MTGTLWGQSPHKPPSRTRSFRRAVLPFLMARSIVSLVTLAFWPFHGDVEARVEVRFGTPELGRDHDFADELSNDLSFLCGGFTAGLFPLSTHVCGRAC